MPVLRSVDDTWCAEDVQQFVALEASSSAGGSVASVASTPSNASSHLWYSSPRFNHCTNHSAPVNVSGANSQELCYKFEYGADFAFSTGARPITGIPAAHPTVTRPGGIRSCVTRLGAGDPIPATGVWHDSGCGTAVPGGDLFYAYNFPVRASANTGYDFTRTLGMYFVQDAAGSVYLVLTVGKRHSVSGKLTMYATSTGLAGTSARMIRSDDRNEAKWDAAAGTGTFKWRWASCCGDGAVLGPLPSNGFTLSLTASEWQNVDTVRLASYNHASQSLDFVSVDTATAFGLGNTLRVSGFTCGAYCATFASCGECTASDWCGWCGATSRCLSAAQVSAYSAMCPGDYSAESTCCDVCSSQVTAAACLAQPGCGFLYDRTGASPNTQAGNCVSGIPGTSPCSSVVSTGGSDLSLSGTVCSRSD